MKIVPHSRLATVRSEQKLSFETSYSFLTQITLTSYKYDSFNIPGNLHKIEQRTPYKNTTAVSLIVKI